MKKYTYIICFFCLIAVFTLIYYIGYKKTTSDSLISDNNNSEYNSVSASEISETESFKTATENEDVSAINYENLSFIIKSVDDNIIIYYEDGVTVFLDTGISISDLDGISREMLEIGVKIESAQELFDLLETYSS